MTFILYINFYQWWWKFLKKKTWNSNNFETNMEYAIIEMEYKKFVPGEHNVPFFMIFWITTYFSQMCQMHHYQIIG